MNQRLYLFLSILFLSISSCSSDKSLSPNGTVTIKFDHAIDVKPLIRDTTIYYNAVKEKYSVSKLEYFISDIKFYRKGEKLFSYDTAYYVNAKLINSNSITLENMPIGNYDSMTYVIGLNPSLNVYGNLPQNSYIESMKMPDSVGSGYAFMKMEGNWKIGKVYTKYSILIGNNPFLIYGSGKINFNINPGRVNTAIIRMNINEWFRNPNQYSFQTDGDTTANNPTLMYKLIANGNNVMDFIQ